MHEATGDCRHELALTGNNTMAGVLQTCAQVLATAESLVSKRQCRRVESTFTELLALDVVPIVNENVCVLRSVGNFLEISSKEEADRFPSTCVPTLRIELVPPR